MGQDFFTESKIEQLKSEREQNLLDALLADDAESEDGEHDSWLQAQIAVQRVLSIPAVQNTTLVLIVVDFTFGLASLLLGFSDKETAKDFEGMFHAVAISCLR